MNSIDKLTQIFSQFPGIGPRQAKRFVYYLLARNTSALEDLAKYISDLKNDVLICRECMRFFESKSKNNLCGICSDKKRDHSSMMVVQRDIDLESVEKNGAFSGVYFVLGGSVPILEKEPEKRIRIKDLEARIKEDKNLKEIILAMNWNPEGENTAGYIHKTLEPTIEHLRQIKSNDVKISSLGKGLSMGAELEYIDPDTLKNALKNRG